MKSIKGMLALGLIVAMVLSMGAGAFAEGEVTAEAPAISIEQPEIEQPKAEAPKAEQPKAEQPKAEEKPEVAIEQAEQETKANDEQASAPAQDQVSDAIEIGSESIEAELTTEAAVPEAAEAPAATEQPAEAAEIGAEIAAEEQEITTIEDEMTPLAIRPSTPIDGSVRIFSSTAQPKLGEHVRLTSELKGFEGDYTLIFQWQIDKGDGWRNISGANGRTLEFTYTERMQNCRWRLTISIDE